jgi:hypothetical protein
MRRATEAALSWDKPHLTADCLYRGVVVGGVVERKVAELGGRYTEIFEHCPIARMRAYQLRQHDRLVY